MRASIIRLRFTLGFCFLLLISNVKGFPSRLNRNNEVKNWLKVRSVESSNGKTLFAGEYNSCEDFSNLGAIIFTILQEALPTLIGRCPFKTIQMPTNLAAELGGVKMSNGKINQSYITPSLPTSSELPNNSYTSKKLSHSLLALIPGKIGGKNLAYTQSANASILLKIFDTAASFSTANVSLGLSINNGKISTGLAMYLKTGTVTLKISDLSAKLANMAVFITVVEILKGLDTFSVSELLDSYLTAYHSSMVKTKATNFLPENSCRFSNSSIIELLNTLSSNFLYQKITKAINVDENQEMNENRLFLISRMSFSYAGKDMNYSSLFFLKTENYSTATENSSLRTRPFIGSSYILKTREALNQTSKTTPAPWMFSKSCISQQFSVNISLISQNISPSSTLKSATVMSNSGIIEIGKSLSESGKIEKALFSHTLSLGSVLLDKAIKLKYSQLRTMVPGICSKYFAVNLTVLNLIFCFEPTINVDHSQLTNTHESFTDSKKSTPSNSIYLPPFIECKENCSSRTFFWSSASFNSTQNIFFSNSDSMINNSGILTNTLESHTAAHTSVSKKDPISIMRPGMMTNLKVGYNESADEFKILSSWTIFDCSLPTPIPKSYNFIG